MCLQEKHTFKNQIDLGKLPYYNDKCCLSFTGSSSSSFREKLGKYDRPIAKSDNDC